MYTCTYVRRWMKGKEKVSIWFMHRHYFSFKMFFLYICVWLCMRHMFMMHVFHSFFFFSKIKRNNNFFNIQKCIVTTTKEIKNEIATEKRPLNGCEKKTVNRSKNFIILLLFFHTKLLFLFIHTHKIHFFLFTTFKCSTRHELCFFFLA